MKKDSQQGATGSGQDKNSQIIIYQTKDGQTKLDVRLEDETVWLSQDQMAELYGKSKSTINEHVKNVYEEHELAEETTLRKFGNSEFSTKPTNFYNLDMIISVGYRVKSIQGTQFRIWATQRIKEYIIKGFTLDDERLKQGGPKARYFQELLQRIRDIRSTKRCFRALRNKPLVLPEKSAATNCALAEAARNIKNAVAATEKSLCVGHHLSHQECYD